ncbi:hypothetical protein F4553_000573 [Allocatelliglobosispora scoriae]|uniref:Uncharacterized protein n=1 Tax=Allocatelliglobosispora scoriae TaxID=643052 RepID=A0A841BFX9_9ACTN|nr:hypothetical protein [Allocatelliglobosispora scoriae]MBB5867194.1 hypothetical protein [Allocatelliglobosispora scoriae]
MRRKAIAITAGLALAVAAAAPAHAVPYYELRYQGTMSSATVVTDSSSNLNDGTVSTANSGTVTSVTDPGTTDPYLAFGGTECATAPCPQALITPASSSTLVANGGGTSTFTFGANIRLHTGASSVTAGMNVIQFGSAGTGLHQWKLQADYWTPSCRWSDGTTAVLVPGPGDPKFTLTDNVWYKVKCSRLTGNVFEIRITDLSTGLLASVLTKTVALGAITPTGAAAIGARVISANKVDSQTDQFHGDLDDIFFHRD